MDKEQRKRLAELREKADKRAREEQDAKDLRELAARELEEKLEQHTGGKRGVDFEIVVNPFGVFGLRRPDHQAIGNWDRATTEKRLSLDWQVNLLRHYILPDPLKEGLQWAEIGAERPGLVFQTAELFAKLMGVERDAEGKG